MKCLESIVEPMMVQLMFVLIYIQYWMKFLVFVDSFLKRGDSMVWVERLCNSFSFVVECSNSPDRTFSKKIDEAASSICLILLAHLPFNDLFYLVFFATLFFP